MRTEGGRLSRRRAVTVTLALIVGITLLRLVRHMVVAGQFSGTLKFPLPTPFGLAAFLLGALVAHAVARHANPGRWGAIVLALVLLLDIVTQWFGFRWGLAPGAAFLAAAEAALLLAGIAWLSLPRVAAHFRRRGTGA